MEEIYFEARAAAKAASTALRQWRKAVAASGAARSQWGPDRHYFWHAVQAAYQKAARASQMAEAAIWEYWEAEEAAEDAHQRVVGPVERAAARAEAAAKIAKSDLPARRAKRGRGGRKPRRGY